MSLEKVREVGDRSVWNCGVDAFAFVSHRHYPMHRNAAFTPGHLYPCTCRRIHVSCIGDKIIASSSLAFVDGYKRIQVDRDVNE